MIEYNKNFKILLSKFFALATMRIVSGNPRRKHFATFYFKKELSV